MWWLSLLCIFASLVEAQQYPPHDDPKVLLFEVRKKVLQTVQRLPKYLCTETIDRSTFQPEATDRSRSCDDLASRRKKTDWRLHQDTSDRLRLDVAVSDHNEMYSWVGEDRFEDRSLADLVGRGTTVTGTFSASLSTIFGTNSASFTYDGDQTISGRSVVEFGFRVPVERSTYSIGTKSHHAIVGYEGTFLVDPRTFDLLRLTLLADQIPEQLNACETTTTLHYGRMQLNNSEFLLPTEASTHVIRADGSESENHAAFSGCHEFLGESTLRFDIPSETERVAAQNRDSKPLTLPTGLPFTIALTQAINTATAAAGDPIRAKLTSAIREKHHGILVPKGAAVTGRIVQIEWHYRPESQSLMMAVKLETVEANGVLQPFEAQLELVGKIALGPRSRRVDLGSFEQMEAPGTSLLRFEDVTRDYVIHRGLEIKGITAAK